MDHSTIPRKKKGEIWMISNIFLFSFSLLLLVLVCKVERNQNLGFNQVSIQFKQNPTREKYSNFFSKVTKAT